MIGLDKIGIVRKMLECEDVEGSEDNEEMNAGEAYIRESQNEDKTR